jgi:enoyl-CoA hydratase/carnithine racemase
MTLMATEPGQVQVTVRGTIGEINFSNPPTNFASAAILGAIADAMDRLDSDPAVRCMLLTATGKAFCAGADLKDGEAGDAGDAGVSAIDRFYAQAERLFRRKKPMVAAIQGAAIGAGLGLALTADFRIAAPEARFSANFVRLGFHPGFGLTCTLPRVIGQQRANWMMLSAERVKPQAALDWGLVDRLASGEDLYAQAEAMALEIAENAPLSLVEVRQTVSGNLGDEVRAAMQYELSRQALLRETLDYAEGVASVFERRSANFVGR